MKTILTIAAALVIAVLSLVAFILYGVDKKRAEKGQWRIKEATLLLLGFFGGAIGALAAMKFFRHKTKHWYFWVVNFIGLLWQLLLLIWLLAKL